MTGIRDFAIDLGTTSTLVWAKGRGIVFDEPTVAAVDPRTGSVRAIGRDAYTTIAHADGQLVADRPLRGGAIADFATTSRLLKLLLAKLGATSGMARVQRPRLLLCVPHATTPVERRAVEEAAHKAGASAAYLMEEPMAAAIGAGLPVNEPVGSMVVDVGGGTAQVAVVSLGGIVTGSAVRVGSLDIDAAIAAWLRTQHDLAIGERTAEEIKISIGSAWPDPDEPQAEVRGRELSTGLERTVVVTAAEVRAAIEDSVAAIVRAVADCLGECPPELVHDVLGGGIWLVGGGSQLRGLDARIAHEVQVKVNRAADPLGAVIAGAGETLEAHDDLGRFFARS